MLRITLEQRDILDKLEKAMGHMSRCMAPVRIGSMQMELKNNIENLETKLKSAGDISGNVSLRGIVQN